MNNLTAHEVRELFLYDAETGDLTYLRKPRRGIRVGSPAGWYDRLGYRRVIVNNKQYFVHRIAWLYTYGEFPEGEIDHINGNPSDNRISNLRDVDRAKNQQNIIAARSTNLSGLRGAFKIKSKWMSKIHANGTLHYLGYFDTAEAAHQAYMDAKERLHIHGGRKSPQ